MTISELPEGAAFRLTGELAHRTGKLLRRGEYSAIVRMGGIAPRKFFDKKVMAEVTFNGPAEDPGPISLATEIEPI
jgi:hypothetical protein